MDEFNYDSPKEWDYYCSGEKGTTLAPLPERRIGFITPQQFWDYVRFREASQAYEEWLLKYITR